MTYIINLNNGFCCLNKVSFNIIRNENVIKLNVIDIKIMSQKNILNLKLHPKMNIDHSSCIHQILSKESSLEVLNKTRGNVVALMFHIFHYFQPIHTKNHIQCLSHLVHHLWIIYVIHKMVRWKFCPSCKVRNPILL